MERDEVSGDEVGKVLNRPVAEGALLNPGFSRG